MSTAALTREPQHDKFRGEIALSRLRIAQVALIGAMDSNRELLVNESWQTALCEVNRMIQDAKPAEDDARQLVLFNAKAA